MLGTARPPVVDPCKLTEALITIHEHLAFDYEVDVRQVPMDYAELADFDGATLRVRRTASLEQQWWVCNQLWSHLLLGIPFDNVVLLRHLAAVPALAN